MFVSLPWCEIKGFKRNRGTSNYRFVRQIGLKRLLLWRTLLIIRLYLLPIGSFPTSFPGSLSFASLVWVVTWPATTSVFLPATREAKEREPGNEVGSFHILEAIENFWFSTRRSIHQIWTMISSLANYRPFFSSFPHIPPRESFVKLAN